MKPCIIIILFSLLLTGCAHETPQQLPLLIENQNQNEAGDCLPVFPKGKWQFVHTIDFTMRDGSGSSVIGITILGEDTIRCALVTVEGLTLFQAVFTGDNNPVVHKAVPPFDTLEFAKGMRDDIRRIFRTPAGSVLQPGSLSDSTPVCRYTGSNGRITDVLPDNKGCWQIKTYTADRILDSSISAHSCEIMGSSIIPQQIELRTFGRTGYTLSMTLLQADILP